MTSKTLSLRVKGFLCLTLCLLSSFSFSQELDDTFNAPQFVRAASVFNMIELSDGGFLLEGDVRLYGDTPVPWGSKKIKSDGSLDESFNASQSFALAQALPNGDIIGFNGLQVVRLNRTGKTIAKSADFWTGVSALALLPDGRVLAATWDGGLRCLDYRLKPDRRFNSSGTYFNGYVGDIKLQGRALLVSGAFTLADSTAANGLVRLDLDGNVDQSFHPELGPNGWIDKIFVQSDNKILFSNSSPSDPTGQPYNRFIRLNANGTLDQTFNSNYFDFAGRIFEANDKLYIQSFYFVQRLHMDGTIDESFQLFLNYDGWGPMVLTSNDELVTANVRNDFNPYGFLKYDLNGVLDSTFHPALGRYGLVRSVAKQGDKLIVGGDFFRAGTTTVQNLVRLNADGTLDQTFTQEYNPTVQKIVTTADGIFVGYGYYLTKFDVNGNRDFTFWNQSNLSPVAFEVLADGKILLSDGRGIARLNSDGTQDNTFYSVVDQCCYFQEADFGVQSDGKIIYKTYPWADLGLPSIVRLESDGNADYTFQGGDGVDGLYDALIDIEVLKNDDVILTGFISSYNGTPVYNNLVKVSKDGEIDDAFRSNFQQGQDIFVSIRARKFRGGFGAVLYANDLYTQGALRFYTNDGIAISNQIIPSSITSIWGDYTDFYAADDNTIYIMGEITVGGITKPIQLGRVLVPNETETNSVAAAFELYPNPASDFLKISADRETNVTLSSTDGLITQTFSVAADKNEIDIRTLRPGKYVITLVQNGRKISKHFFKK
jgi:uncharacterized delta-60 repeat protein